MKIRTLIGALGLLLVPGWAAAQSGVWVRADTSPDEAQADFAQCQASAAHNFPPLFEKVAGRDALIEEAAAECMQGDGYLAMASSGPAMAGFPAAASVAFFPRLPFTPPKRMTPCGEDRLCTVTTTFWNPFAN
jgi:hypothetical protein